MRALLHIAGLSKIYPVADPHIGLWKRRASERQLYAVDDISFSIGRGESLGLVGESGCGKSTVVRLIARLLDPTSGAIKFEDRDIAPIPARRFAMNPLRRAIQVVFQDPTDSLDPRFTAFDTIAEPIRLLDRDGDGRSIRDRVAEAGDSRRVAAGAAARLPHQLSGGQKARVNIARAIAVRPRLLILDEPTSALDVSVQAVILRLLDDLRQRLGMSYLFVSHDLNIVRLLCQNVVVMYLGRIVEMGPIADVFNTPRHPYTRALIDAIPRRSRTRVVRLAGEPRAPSIPIQPLAGSSAAARSATTCVRTRCRSSITAAGGIRSPAIRRSTIRQCVSHALNDGAPCHGPWIAKQTCPGDRGLAWARACFCPSARRGRSARRIDGPQRRRSRAGGTGHRPGGADPDHGFRHGPVRSRKHSAWRRRGRT